MTPNATPPGQHEEKIREVVRERYAAAAQSALGQKTSSCCGAGSCCPAEDLSDKAKDFISRDLYSDSEIGGLPLAAHLASLGCGNPTALAELSPGEVVLDLGSGGGIDVLLSARRVGADGFVYGLDMTDEMLDLAERNRVEAGVSNVEFLKGQIEEIPLPDATVDVIISNCVINLSADKDRVLREAHRVLKPGGRFAVSDVVVDGELGLPDEIRSDLLAWSGCVAGALSVEDYLQKLRASGFETADVEPVRRYEIAAMVESGYGSMIERLTAEQRENIDGRIMSAFIRARKGNGTKG
ncbi:MAG: arsenite methyltransferase [Candidatus Sumerlaeaceae bacterium]|nr:arsenite methyltransferase [Candidatus Sumerlaeaceae bacterium]